MRIRRWSSVVLVPVVLLATSARAHDGWLEAHPFIVERGQPLSLFLMFGNHSNDHKSYRLAGKWQPEYSTVTVTGPSGPPIDLTDQITDLGDAIDVGPKGPKGFHLAAFVPAQEGVYVAFAKQTRDLQFDDGPTFHSIATAKVVFAALETPVVAATRRLTGFARAVGGPDVLEIVPLTNPLAVRIGQSMTLEVRHRGQPAPNQTVTVVQRIVGGPSAQTFMTDRQGQATIVTGAADYYLVRVSLEERVESGDSPAAKRAYEASYVFPVYRP